MTTPNPSPDDPQGTSAMEPAPGTAPDGTRQLLDAGALEDSGTAKEDLAEVAASGDQRLREAEQRTDVASEDDALSPSSASAPQTTSPGRGEGAGHAQGGTTTSGR